MGQSLDMIFAQVGQIGPCARPETARHIEYGTNEYIKPDNHIDAEATVKHTDIIIGGDENNLSK